MRGQSEHNTRLYARWPPIILDMDAWMTSQLNVALIRKLRGSLVCLNFFFSCFSLVLRNQALTDVWSTVAWIKCLYCTNIYFSNIMFECKIIPSILIMCIICTLRNITNLFLVCSISILQLCDCLGTILCNFYLCEWRYCYSQLKGCPR